MNPCLLQVIQHISWYQWLGQGHSYQRIPVGLRLAPQLRTDQDSGVLDVINQHMGYIDGGTQRSTWSFLVTLNVTWEWHHRPRTSGGIGVFRYTNDKMSRVIECKSGYLNDKLTNGPFSESALSTPNCCRPISFKSHLSTLTSLVSRSPSCNSHRFTSSKVFIIRCLWYTHGPDIIRHIKRSGHFHQSDIEVRVLCSPV